MSNIAIIPARGGSKRLPKKNVLSILGQPMLTYPVTNAVKSGLFDQVIVSTEDAVIEKIGKDAGAVVLKRPEELVQDRSTVAQVCEHVLEELAKDGIVPEFFCCIYATALFITYKDILESFSMLTESPEPDVVMGVSKYNLQPVQALVAKDKFLNAKWPEYYGIQSQFHPRLVASNGTLYWARTKEFLQAKTFYPEKLKGYEISWIRAVDIDTPEDLKIAEMLALNLLNNEDLT